MGTFKKLVGKREDSRQNTGDLYSVFDFVDFAITASYSSDFSDGPIGFRKGNLVEKELNSR